VSPLRVTLDEDRGWTVVLVDGVVDVATAPQLRQTLQEAQFGGGARVLVDLDRVELLDSFGLGVLVGALKRARTHGGELRVRVTRERLRQVFAVTGLDASFRLVTDREEAVAADDARASTAGREGET
jgi:anti-sigma B factor antagonist